MYGVNDLGQRIFCPDRGVTRAEMAVFIDRAKGQAELPAGTPTFADVPANYWAYGWIERFFTLGVTTGCGTDDSGKKVYCPDRGVTRAENGRLHHPRLPVSRSTTARNAQRPGRQCPGLWLV